jgi:hypothetical protein
VGLKPGEYHYHNDGTTSTESAGGAVKESGSSSSGSIKADKVIKPTAGKLSVYFLNVGQGDATYIKTAVGDDILIDAGKKIVKYANCKSLNQVYKGGVARSSSKSLILEMCEKLFWMAWAS